MDFQERLFVRRMQLSEKEDVKALFARSLGITDRIIFQLSFDDAQKSARKQCGDTLIEEYDGKIVGAVSMRIQEIENTRTGFIDALVVDKQLRGKAIGKSLVNGAILWLEERGCKVIYATADRYNSPSWNIFIHKGFRLYEAPQQLRDYGLNFLRLWLGEFYFIGFGTFFLRWDKEPIKPRETDEAWHWVTAFLGVSIVWWIQILRSQGPITLVPASFVVTATSILVHELSQKIAARSLGIQTTFKAWISGILFSWLIALAGGFFPAYGSTYVKQIDWRYEPQKDKTGIIFALGSLVSLVLAFAFWALPNLTTGSLIMESARLGYATNLMLAVFNLIPIQAAGGFVWDGKKILTWNRMAWATLAIAIIALIILDIFF
ncbi:GNAT family N-acetyltransferase [Candidatus Bathyarchaeota archaeon]|nr:GNAT family N-acetyltransferase [Candidatus Bathyarchaeota archaeon]